MKRRGLFFSLSILLILVPAVLFSYDDDTTHPGLTSEIVDFYNLSFPNQKISTIEKQWIIQGSVDEDTWPRWINHFYDPVYNQGWTAEGFGSISSSTGRWLNTILLSDHPPLASKYWAQSPSTQAEYKDFGGNQTWQRAQHSYISGDKQAAFTALGHILHLLEDATVPEHTRNDTHAHPLHLFTGDEGSPYESFAKRYYEMGGETNLPINALTLSNLGVHPIVFSTLTTYFNVLALYSNNYFFSKDTVQIPKYTLPLIIRSDNDYGYGKDADGSIFPLVRKVVQRQKDFSWAIAYVLNDVVVDQVILKAYFDRLSRAAIVHGAGVIHLFFNQTAHGQAVSQPPEVAGVHSVLADVTKIKSSLVAVVETVKQAVSTTVVDLVSIQPQVLGEKIFAEPVAQNVPAVTAALPIQSYGGGGGGAVLPLVVAAVVQIPVLTDSPTTTFVIPTTTVAVDFPTATTTEDIVTTSTVPVIVVTSTPPLLVATSTDPSFVTTTPIAVQTSTPITIPTTTPVITTTSTPVVPPVIAHDPVFLNGRQTSTARQLTKAEGPYMLGYYEIPVGAALSMESGTVVKSFYADSKIDIYGSLMINGVADDMVILSSGRDIQTSDGLVFGARSGVPQAKDWQGLWFHSGSVGVLHGMEMRYAGKNFRVNNFLYTGFVSQAIRVESAHIELDGNRFLYDGDVAVRLENSSATILNTFFGHGVRAIESLLGSMSIVGATFTNYADSHGPVLLRDNWPNVLNVTLENNAADVLYVEAATVTSTAHLFADTLYYLNNVTVAVNATMTIDPGSLVYLADNSFIQINGTLIAEGADGARIHFRSFVDKTYWGALRFDGGRGRLSYTVLENGNYNFPFAVERGGMLMLLHGSDVLVNNSVLGDRKSAGNSVYVNSSTLVMNDSMIGQNDHTQFSNSGILIDQGVVSLIGVAFKNLSTAIKAVSLPLPTVLISGVTFSSVDYVSDPLGIVVP